MTKNVPKNYGQAICSFVLTKPAAEYLERFANQFDVNIDEFKKYIIYQKALLKGIDTFKAML